ncbi:DMT family transporter [Ramlibacter sp.]|uniref:DMT family transporter n=1 Tax=Ramlibacter sp. TaxID=1917967 RepID=UPI003D0F7878
MQQRLSLSTVLLLATPPLLWAANAVVGRLLAGTVPPITLNFIRWMLAFALLLPFAGWVLRRGGPFWPRWRRYWLVGLLGVGCYNALQYLALTTSSPVNTTLVGASSPIFILAFGALFYGKAITGRQMLGAALSMAGVLVVLARGEPAQLAQVRFVIGDVYMLLATLSWAWYSWLLADIGADAPEVRNDWTAFLMVQIVPGLMWSGLFAAGEWAVAPRHIEWSATLLIALAFVAIFPAILAYRAFGMGVQRVGPSVVSFFANLTPLFAALLATAFLGEPPRVYHGLAFALIVGGILVSSRRH